MDILFWDYLSTYFNNHKIFCLKKIKIMIPVKNIMLTKINKRCVNKKKNCILISKTLNDYVFKVNNNINKIYSRELKKITANITATVYSPTE